MSVRRTVLPSSCRQRLLEAAAQVFAQEGLKGATTRAIARRARVNEVTLFRLFGTKAGLLDAVVRANFGPQPAAPAASVQPPASGDLRADLTAHARRYERLLHENLPLIRAMIGEIHHHAGHERQVFLSIFRPLRDALVTRLAAARRAGLLRRQADPEILSDLFNAMIFTGVLRRASSQVRRSYRPAAYLNAAVALVLEGTAA